MIKITDDDEPYSEEFDVNKLIFYFFHLNFFFKPELEIETINDSVPIDKKV